MFVSWTRHLRTAARRLPAKGILDRSVPAACAFSLITPFVAFLPPRFLFFPPPTPSVCPVLVTLGALCLDAHLPRLPSKTTSKRVGLCLGFGQTALDRLRDLSRTQIPTVHTLLSIPIIKRRQGRQKQAWSKFPINLQDISSEAASHSACDQTLRASMSKCHYK